MTLIEFSQIFFNFVASIAIIIVAGFISIICYSVIKFIKSVKQLSSNIQEESAELYRKLNNFMHNISKLSLVTDFFKKKKSK